MKGVSSSSRVGVDSNRTDMDAESSSVCSDGSRSLAIERIGLAGS